MPKDISERIRQCDDETDIIFAPFGHGKELDVFPFLRHFGNSTWKVIRKWSSWQWDTFQSIIRERKVSQTLWWFFYLLFGDFWTQFSRCFLQLYLVLACLLWNFVCSANVAISILQRIFDLHSPKCLIDALYRHQLREKLPDGKPKIDETDIHMITREAIGAGQWREFAYQLFICLSPAGKDWNVFALLEIMSLTHKTLNWIPVFSFAALSFYSQGREGILRKSLFDQATLCFVWPGVLTTFRAAHSFIAIMANNPDVQKKIQNEVDDVVGGRLPRLSDRRGMHYTEAVRFLILRLFHVVETLLLH